MTGLRQDVLLDRNALFKEFKGALTEQYVLPLEVKADVNLQAKSLKVYREKFKPGLSVRASMTDYRREDWLLNLPLWTIETLFNHI